MLYTFTLVIDMRNTTYVAVRMLMKTKDNKLDSNGSVNRFPYQVGEKWDSLSCLTTTHTKDSGNHLWNQCFQTVIIHNYYGVSFQGANSCIVGLCCTPSIHNYFDI